MKQYYHHNDNRYATLITTHPNDYPLDELDNTLINDLSEIYPYSAITKINNTYRTIDTTSCYVDKEARPTLADTIIIIIEEDTITIEKSKMNYNDYTMEISIQQTIKITDYTHIRNYI